MLERANFTQMKGGPLIRYALEERAAWSWGKNGGFRYSATV